MSNAVGASTFRTTNLHNRHAQVTFAVKALLATIVFPLLCTLALDSWTDPNGASVWLFIALLPGIGAITLKTMDASSDSHTGEWISGMLLLLWPTLPVLDLIILCLC